ncbi:MAG: SseB family protein [Flavobacteriales bacterium]
MAIANPPDNARMRAAMVAFVEDPTKEQGLELIRTMMAEKFTVIVPMVREADGSSVFTTVVDATPHPVLHVYTAIEEIPEQEEDVELYQILFADLIVELIKGEERWNGVIVDPDAAHSITQYFPSTGGHMLLSTAAVRKAGGQINPADN